MFFNVFTVFFVNPSGPLDLLMYVWVTFSFFFFFASLGIGDVILLHLLGVQHESEREHELSVSIIPMTKKMAAC